MIQVEVEVVKLLIAGDEDHEEEFDEGKKQLAVLLSAGYEKFSERKVRASRREIYLVYVLVKRSEVAMLPLPAATPNSIQATFDKAWKPG